MSSLSKIQVAIDGPVSSGKSTVGSKVASQLNYLFIDTGLMYRAIAWKIQAQFASEKEWGNVALGSKFEWRGDKASPNIFLDGADVTGKLYYPEISLLSSRVATNPNVRKALVAMQKAVAKDGGVAMVGRDIATVVLPEAAVKVFLTASVDTRAKRRHEELEAKGIKTSFDQVKSEMIRRDEQDSTRKDSPLRPAPDSVSIDATNLDVEQVVSQIVSLVKSKDN